MTTALTTSKRDPENLTKIMQFFESNMDKWDANVVPAGVKAVQIVQSAVNILRKPDRKGDRRLLDCRPDTVAWAIIEAMYAGYPVNTSQQYAFLVPYKGECQFQVGWRGLCDMAMQSPGVQVANTGVVYPCDTFSVQQGTDPKIIHQIDLAGSRDKHSEITHVYAVVQYMNGGFDFELMTRAQVEAIRKKSPSSDSPAWRDHWDEMARGKVLKRLLKRVPKGDRVAEVIDLSNRRDDGERVRPPVDVELPPEIDDPLNVDSPMQAADTDDVDNLEFGGNAV